MLTATTYRHMSDIRTRLKEVAATYGLSIADFSKRIRASAGYVYSVREKISSEKLQDIIDAFPEISATWLFTGEGPKFARDAPDGGKIADLTDAAHVKQRLLKFISLHDIKHSDFETRAGLSNGYLRNIKGNIGAKKLEDILSAYPALSRTWLLTGQGPMTNPDAPQLTVEINRTNSAGDDAPFGEIIKIQSPDSQTAATIADLQKEIDHLHQLLDEKDRTIATLRENLDNLHRLLANLTGK